MSLTEKLSDRHVRKVLGITALSLFVLNFSIFLSRQFEDNSEAKILDNNALILHQLADNHRPHTELKILFKGHPKHKHILIEHDCILKEKHALHRHTTDHAVHQQHRIRIDRRHQDTQSEETVIIVK